MRTIKILSNLLLSIILLTFANISAQEEEEVGNVSGVTLVQFPKHDETARVVGRDFLARNSNDFPVLVSIKLTEKNNVFDGLVWIKLRIAPETEGYLGWVIQDDPTVEANWEYEWKVERGE